MSSSETQSVSDSSKSEMPIKDLKVPEMPVSESQTLNDTPKVKTPTSDLDDAVKVETQAPLANGNAKRKAEETEEIDAPPPSKKQKTKAATKAKAKSEKSTAAKPAEPKKKRINKALREKVQQVLDFLASTAGTRSSLERSKENKNHVTVKESALLGALMSLRADYEVSDPRMASVLDVEDVTVREFVARIGTDQVLVKFLGMFLVKSPQSPKTFRANVSLVVDLSKQTTLETSIHQRIENWGLGEVSLLEAELEMYSKQLEDAAVNILLDAIERAGSPSPPPSPEEGS